MTNILAQRNRPVLAGFASSNVLLAFDYDGTLAPIVAEPERARMRDRTRRLLADVARCYPCVVISGRRLDDVTRRLGRIPVWYVFGNFGHEPAAAAHQPTERMRDRIETVQSSIPLEASVRHRRPVNRASRTQADEEARRGRTALRTSKPFNERDQEKSADIRRHDQGGGPDGGRRNELSARFDEAVAWLPDRCRTF